MNPNVIAAVITGFITILGWIVSNFIARKREDRTRRLQLTLEYTSKQIEELYGPLYSNIQQIFNVWEVRQRIIEPQTLRTEDEDKVKVYFREKYFSPLHSEARQIIKTKFHLIEGKQLPESFWMYLQHSTQETSQIDLWHDLKINTSFVSGIPWPSQYPEDVKRTLNKLMDIYENLLLELK